MYTRSYFAEESKSAVPENYDGNAFPKAQTNEPAAEEVTNPFIPPRFDEGREEETVNKSSFGVSSIMEKLPIKNLSSIFPFLKGGHNGKFDFGTEEILICAAALYMFFSKNGDKECAIMLLILLFIY